MNVNSLVRELRRVVAGGDGDAEVYTEEEGLGHAGRLERVDGVLVQGERKYLTLILESNPVQLATEFAPGVREAHINLLERAAEVAVPRSVLRFALAADLLALAADFINLDEWPAARESIVQALDDAERLLGTPPTRKE